MVLLTQAFPGAPIRRAFGQASPTAGQVLLGALTLRPTHAICGSVSDALEDARSKSLLKVRLLALSPCIWIAPRCTGRPTTRALHITLPLFGCTLPASTTTVPCYAAHHSRRHPFAQPL